MIPRHIKHTAHIVVLLILSCAVYVTPTAAQTPQKPQLLMHPLTDVKGADWSPDGTRIVSWADDKAYVWDAQTGDQLFTIQHGGGFSSLYYGPLWNSDQQKNLSWSEKTVWIWDANNGTQLETIEHDKDIDRAIWSPGGRYVVTWFSFFQTKSTRKYEIHLYMWESSSGKQLADITVPGGFMQTVTWSPDETQLITLSTGDGGGLKAWNVSDGTEISALDQPGQLSFSTGDIVWSKDGNHILVSGINGEAYIADTKIGIKALSIQNDSWIWGAYWSPDESKIVGVLPTNRVVFIWDSATGTTLQTLRHQYFVTNATWSEDGNRILTSSTNGFNQSAVDIWNAITGSNLFHIGESTRSAFTAWDVSNKYLLGWFTDPFQANGTGTWKVWEVSSGTELLSGTQTSDTLGALSPLWSPTESRLLTWQGTELQVWAF